jgi:hypothetical protein
MTREYLAHRFEPALIGVEFARHNAAKLNPSLS